MVVAGGRVYTYINVHTYVCTIRGRHGIYVEGCYLVHFGKYIYIQIRMKSNIVGNSTGRYGEWECVGGSCPSKF